MSLMHEMDIKVQGPLSEESKGLVPFGEMIRDYEPLPNTKWRFGKPNYARVNKAYMEHRTKKHAAGSLEKVVENLVKNWEVESHHISDINQWKTMDVKVFKGALNGGEPIDAQCMADIGPYNMLIGDTGLYAASKHDFASANTLFSNALPDGFAWEVLEVLSGPPTVTFKWRHFGLMTGEFTDKDGLKYKGTGEMVNVIGLCIAKVNEALKIESLDVYWNPDDMITPLTKAGPSSVSSAGIESPAPAAAAQDCRLASCVREGNCSLM